jgi:transcriptional regulator with XRE-family HTH domain
MTIADIDVGSRIRAYRKRKKLSLNELSGLTGIAASNLSSIELNKTSPTLNTLLKIARAFNVKVSVFLEDLAYPPAILCHQAAGQQMSELPDGLHIARLTAQVERPLIEARLVHLAPGSGPFMMDDPAADRFVHCLAGQILARVKEESYELRIGDSLYVRPDSDLSLENRSDEHARVLLVATTPRDANPWCIRGL